GGNNEFMVSNTATKSKNSVTLVMPMSSSPQPSSGGYVDHHQDPSEDLTKSFFKKRMGRCLGFKNKPKTCTVIEEDTQNFIEWSSSIEKFEKLKKVDKHMLLLSSPMLTM
ncbi:hypothetical protein RYX36_011098, partial [Vicia faba]